MGKVFFKIITKAKKFFGKSVLNVPNLSQKYQQYKKIAVNHIINGSLIKKVEN